MKRLAIVIFVFLAMVAFLVPPIPVTANGPTNAPGIHIKGSTFLNWAGYAVQSPQLYPNNQNHTVTDVKGSWTVPKVDSGASGYSSVWVGIDGYSDNTVEQIGTEQDYDSATGQATYYAWYEMYPKMSQRITSVQIHPGDSITAEVKYNASGNFTLTITDNSNNSNAPFKTIQTSKRVQRNSAEWVVEAPSSGGVLSLDDFQSVTFTGASVNGLAIDATGWQSDPMTMVNPGGIANPSSLTDSGSSSSFYVTYAPSTSINSGPTVTGLDPASSPAGTPVTITGTNFTGVTGVNFGTTPATNVAVNSDTQITATSPAGSGTVDVTVTTPSGTSDTNTTPASADQFTYSIPPTVDSISPTSGPASGGTPVTITGTNFTGATGVNFGNTAANFVVNSDTQIIATSPAGSGTVDVTVTTPNGGTSVTSSADQFTYTTVASTLSVSVTTNKGAYKTNELGGTITVTVASGGSPVSGAEVSVSITGSGYDLNSPIETSDLAGTAVFDFTAPPSRGTYTVKATATYDNYTSNAYTTFKVH